MVLQDIIDLAKFSELSSVAIKDNTAAVILFLNSGLTELYGRFPVKVDEHIITLDDSETEYLLPTDFLYPLKAYGEAPEGSDTLPPQVPINEEDNVYSIFFPDYTKVQIPLNTTGTQISIIYVKKPVRYTEADLEEEVELPESLIESLLCYIGYRGHIGIDSGLEAKANAHYARFEKSCEKAREHGVAFPIDSWETPNRLYERGFE